MCTESSQRLQHYTEVAYRGGITNDRFAAISWVLRNFWQNADFSISTPPECRHPQSEIPDSLQQSCVIYKHTTPLITVFTRAQPVVSPMRPPPSPVRHSLPPRPDTPARRPPCRYLTAGHLRLLPSTHEVTGANTSLTSRCTVDP